METYWIFKSQESYLKRLTETKSLKTKPLDGDQNNTNFQYQFAIQRRRLKKNAQLPHSVNEIVTH